MAQYEILLQILRFLKFCNKIEILLGKSKQVTTFRKFLWKDIAITVFAYFFTKIFLSVDSEEFFH